MNTRDAATLLAVARDSIEHGLRSRAPLDPDPEHYTPPLRALRASFTTLRKRGALRGCTGTLAPTRALVTDVAHTAHRSAFGDSRFAPVREAELVELEIHLSLLGPLEALAFESEETLLARLRPGIDGLVLRDGHAAGTFLPAVWETLETPRRFLEELKRKAGLPTDHWSASLRVERFEVEEIG